MSENILKKERQFISLLLKHKNLVHDWVDSNLVEECFTEEHKFILLSIHEAFEKNVLLTRTSYIDYLRKFKSPRERAKEETIFNNCNNTPANINDFPLLISQIFDDYLLRTVSLRMHEFNEQIKKKGITPSFYDLLETLQSISIDTSQSDRKAVYENIFSLSKEHYDYIEKIRKKEIIIPPKVLTGIREIDETMGIGLAPGTMSLVCADVGAFKSVIMLNIALNVWEAGYDVLFVPIEMAKEQVLIRMWSRQSKVPSSKIQDVTYTDEEGQKITEIINKFDDTKNRFFVLQLPGGTTVSSIKRQIDKHLSFFKPSLIVVDYIDNLDAEKKRDRHDLEISDMLQGLRIMGRDRKFAVLSGAQLGREALRRIRKIGVGKDTSAFNSEDIRGAHSFSMDADYIWAQMPNPIQPNLLLDIYVVKARHGKKMFSSGNMRAHLEVYPEIHLIRSASDFDICDGAGIDKIEMYEKIEEKAKKVPGKDVFDDIDNYMEGKVENTNKEDNTNIENTSTEQIF